MSCSETKFFGMKQGNHNAINDMGTQPLLQLAAELRILSTQIPKSVDGSPVVKQYYDQYLNNFGGPDHLKTATGKCFIERASCSYIYITFCN